VADTVQFLDSPSDRSGLGVPGEGHSGDGDAVAEGDDGRELVGVGAGAEEDDLVF
jgi:hypothetical protein